MPEKLRAILFDAGNTIVFPHLDRVAARLTEMGIAATPEDFIGAERAGKRKLDEWLWPQIRDGRPPRRADYYYWTEYLRALVARLGVPEAKQWEIGLKVAEEFKLLETWSVILPSTAEYLSSLRTRGYRLGVVSNAIGQIEAQLVRAGIASLFEFILDSHFVGVEKPHPEIFQLALDRCGVGPGEALFVGDLYSTDVGGAQNAGIAGVLIDRAGAYPEVPVPRITELPELDAVLLGQPASLADSSLRTKVGG